MSAHTSAPPRAGEDAGTGRQDAYAIVGMSCLFPGARDPGEFWRLLDSGTDARREGGTEVFGTPPADRDADPRHGVYCTRGGFVAGFEFDPAGYRIAADRLAGLDRIFHWTLYAAGEALRDAGHTEADAVLDRTGLILGNYSFPTPASARISVPVIQEAVLEGLRRSELPALAGLASGRPRAAVSGLDPADFRVSGSPAALAAAALGLGGPRYALDAACSSALYALKLACDHLAAGQADLVLAGGVCAPDPTLIHLSFSDLQAYPEDGPSQPFDAGSRGILTGQGAGMVAVKRLADAVRDGDRVYAVVDGIGLCNDGSGRHLLVPNGGGQTQSYELAYAVSGVDPTAIDYLECHATGTPIGDATEAESVAAFFGERGHVPLLGSVKGNIGHLLTVAGLSSLLKVVLAMGHGRIPPTTGVGRPIGSKDGQVGEGVLVRAGREWPVREDGPRRAAVSAFGFGGTNAHVVLSEPSAVAGLPDGGGVATLAAPQRTPPPAPLLAPPIAPPALDVVGIGAHFGPFGSRDAYERAVHDGTDALGPLPERRWRGAEGTAGGTLAAYAGVSAEQPPVGAFIGGIGIDPVDQKIPPADLRTYNLQHALVSKVADEALYDAGYDRAVPKGSSAPPPRRIAVVVAMEIEPTTHLRVTRYRLGGFLRREFERAGLSLTEEQLAMLTALGRDAVVDPIVANEVLSYIGNIMASRISALWNLTGPSFTVSAEGSGTAEALQVAQLLLLDPGIEAVLVGAVDLAGSAENAVLRPGALDTPGLTFGEGARGRRTGEGAGAVVVRRPGSASAPVYGRVESLAVRHAVPVGGVLPEAAAAPLADAATSALATAGLAPSDIGYLEAHAGGTQTEDRAELAAMARVYRASGSADAAELHTALGSAKSQIGDAGCAAAMAGFIRALLCLHHGYVPGTPGWERPSDDLADAFAASALYVPDASRPWLRPARGARRYAAVNLIGSGGAHGHLVLSGQGTDVPSPQGADVPSEQPGENGSAQSTGGHSARGSGALSAPAVQGRPPTGGWERAGGPALLALGGATLQELLAGIERRRKELEGGASSYAVARDAAAKLDRGGLRVVLVGRDAADLRIQLELAARDLPGAYERRGEWATLPGSYFTAKPVGPDAKVALVYPGAFNSYPGLGRDFFRAFPELLARFEEQADEPAKLLRSAMLYPRTQRTPGRPDLMRLEEGLGNDIPFMLATGTSFAILYTELLRDVLGVPVHGGFGYSLGESSMLFATGGWLPEGRRDDLISDTPIFRDRLCGPRRTVREAWGLPYGTPDKDVWGMYVLLAPADAVRDALTRYDRVFLTHINTPGEVVIGGDPARCRALIAELDCKSARAPVNVVMHCPVVDPELDGLAGLNDYPTGSLDGLELFSAYDYEQLPGLDRGPISRRIAHTLRSTIDFPRLVHTAYDRGFRYFIEAGPATTCARWIRETLGDTPHVAAAVDRRGATTVKSIAGLVARLVGNGLPVDLAPLLGAAPPAPATRARFQVGGGDPVPARVAGGTLALAHSAGLLPEPEAEPAPAPGPASGPVSGPAPTQASSPVQARQPDPSLTPQESALMAADPTLTDPEAITFDGEPIDFLPWAPAPSEPTPSAPPSGPTGARPSQRAEGSAQSADQTGRLAGGAPQPPDRAGRQAGPQPVGNRAARGAARVGTGEPQPSTPGATTARTAAATSAAAQLVRELRHQMLATHSVVMETQRILQGATLTQTEALLGTPPLPQGQSQGQPQAALEAPPTRTPLPPPARPQAEPQAGSPAEPPEAAGVIWDEAALLRFATGSVASVFGPEFALIDTYDKRVRLPAPPYHFVTRVTALKGQTGVYEPSTITTEYDVPQDAWYAVDGGVPPAVAVEAGQCDLLLVSYLGIDFRNKGERVYRLLDSSLIFRGGLPRTGQTLRYDISIDRFVHQGDTTLFFFSYHCYADGELILELHDACAGFFSKQELDTPLGVVITEKEKKGRAKLTRKTFKPLARTTRNHLTHTDLELLAQGRPGDVFGPEHAQDPGINPALRLPDERLRMVDDVVIDPAGGPRGLGTLSATKHLRPDAWYFICHFPDDPVLAGSLVAEGAVQLLQIYLLHRGMHLTLPDARFQTVTDERIDVQVRGQITQQHREIRYEVEVTELTLLPRATVMADILVYLGDKPVIRMRNLGLQVREKEGTPHRPEAGGFPQFLGRRNRSGEAAMTNEMHLAHAAKGELGMAMGPEFDIYQGRRAPYIPNGDFQFVDRVMSLTGTRGDLGPGSEMVTEYDSAPESWYYAENAYPHMPNCVYMETSLQAAIFLGYYLGATLKQPDETYAIRNLDGRATLVKDIDLRGKTVRHHSKLLMTSAVTGAVLQNFSYELSADGEVFYTGESLFGYFSDAALANQVGLDNGRYVPPWIEHEDIPAARVRRIELPDDAPAFTDPAGGHLHLPGGRFHLVDHIDLVEDGGKHGKGYLHGYRAVRPDEWYFSCHFHRDPVMPGSLGVEAVLQALRLFVLEERLAVGYEQPRFAMATGLETSWRYRGQILRDDGEMRFDAHIKEVRREADRLLVIADAEVWKPGLRIYELTDVAIEVRPSAA